MALTSNGHTKFTKVMPTIIKEQIRLMTFSISIVNRISKLRCITKTALSTGSLEKQTREISLEIKAARKMGLTTWYGVIAVMLVLGKKCKL